MEMDSKDKRKAAKEFLIQIKHMNERIMEQEEVIQGLRDRLTLPALHYTEKVRESDHHDTFENKMAILLDKQMEHAELIYEYLMLRDEVLCYIMNFDINNMLCSEILYQVYFKYKNLKETAKTLNVSIQTVFHLHPEALEAFYDQFLVDREHAQKAFWN